VRGGEGAKKGTPWETDAKKKRQGETTKGVKQTAHQRNGRVKSRGLLPMVRRIIGESNRTVSRGGTKTPLTNQLQSVWTLLEKVIGSDNLKSGDKGKRSPNSELMEQGGKGRKRGKGWKKNF